MRVSWGGSPPPWSSATPIRSSACREGGVEPTSSLPDFPADVCRGRHPGSFGSGSSFAGPCPVGPTVGVVWSRVFPTRGRSLPRPGCPREHQKGDASSESADTAPLRSGGERRSMGAPFLASRRSLRTASLPCFWPSGKVYGNGNTGGVSWSPTPRRSPARTNGTRGFSRGLEEISTALVRMALTRSYPWERRKGIAVPVLWRVFVPRVEPAFVIVAEF
jgi:hypothetical protein